ncbi:MAG: alpha/beta hydrolase-fold protein [Capsulimonadales bacterium]|nr:alpha/beta hydrolase-fold protein [Capsulimonadales bacterium]
MDHRDRLLSFFALCFVTQPPIPSIGTLERLPHIESEHVKVRNVDVWLPPGYRENPEKRYPVLYMHDGQNLFDPYYSYTGVAWGVDSALHRLIEQGRAPECLVVGVWNTDLRFMEYIPNKPLEYLSPQDRERFREQHYLPNSYSDDYLRFLTGELKPVIDDAYRTLPDRDNTFISGSSMGGLISLYALCEYPHIFGAAACLSTHWPIVHEPNNSQFRDVFLRYLDLRLPDPDRCRVYFDFGTATLDALYEPHQYSVDILMRARGFTPENWVTRKFDGAEHSERSWQERLTIPMEFLLSGRITEDGGTDPNGGYFSKAA